MCKPYESVCRAHHEPARADRSARRAGQRPGSAVGGDANRKPPTHAGAGGRGAAGTDAALVNELVDQLSRMRRAAMKVGQMISMVEFEGRPEDQRR